MEKVIGIDTVVFIYLFEEHPRYLKQVEELLRQVNKGEMQAVLSVIGLIEILTGPKMASRYDLAAQYRELITAFPHLTILGVTEAIVEIASDLRAKYRIATPDAIHLATAIHFDADAFVTNDKGLKRVKEIKVKLLS